MTGLSGITGKWRKKRGGAAILLALGAGAALATPTRADGLPPSYGHDFVTIGAAGNRPALASERFYSSSLAGFPNLGQVNYDYRISRTETTVGQWFNFVNVAWSFAEAAGFPRDDPRFVGSFIQAHSLVPSQPPNYFIPGPDPFGRRADNVATTMSLRFAAWYVNWTEHGQPTTNVSLQTFTTGAYAVTQTTLTRDSGAHYWIPSLDEWTKAVYYDPNRYAPGQEGYWPYSGKSLAPLVGGPPGTPGAQTSAGGWYLPGKFGLPPDVGSYPQTLSAWGLLDTSGGAKEYTDTPDQFFPEFGRVVRGQSFSTDYWTDRVDYTIDFSTLDDGGYTLRLATTIPAPGSVILPMVCLAPLRGRERRRAMT